MGGGLPLICYASTDSGGEEWESDDGGKRGNELAGVCKLRLLGGGRWGGRRTSGDRGVVVIS